MVGHNIGVFDVPILRRYLGDLRYRRLFHYRIRDTAVFARGLSDAGVLKVCGKGKLVDICAALGMEPTAGTHHGAVQDATDEAHAYAAMVRLVKGLLK